MNRIELSVVVSVYNEEEVLAEFLDEMLSVLGIDYLQQNAEIIFVNDGSTDNSRKLINDFAHRYSFVRGVHFSRNFGHEAAMICGIDQSSGKSVICMDSDLQHPPKSIPLMLKAVNDGFDIVLMQRKSRDDKKGLSSLFSRGFYKLLNFLSPSDFAQDSSDFFLVSRRVAQVLKHDYRERTRFLRGIIQIIGFKKIKIQFVAPSRVAGTSKYNFWKLLNFSFEAIAAFSVVPLNLGIIMSLVFGFFTVVVTLYSIVMFFYGNPVSGYTTIVVLISLGFTVTLFVIGLIGKYLAFLFEEIKARPIYVIEESINDSNKNHEIL